MANTNPVDKGNQTSSNNLPLTSIATAGLNPKDAGSASGLFNMMRNRVVRLELHL